MSDFTPIPATLEVRYVPDAYTETEVREGASWPLGAGHYEIGANVDGAFLVLARMKGGGVQKKLAAAKAATTTAASPPAPVPVVAPDPAVTTPVPPGTASTTDTATTG